MAKIYRISDRLKLKIGDLIVTIGPLSIHQKSSVEASLTSTGLLEGTREAMRYAVKNIEGLKDNEGNDYVLDYNEDGYLTDETLEDLFNIEHSYQLSAVCINLIQHIPNEFADPNTGAKLEGVEFIVDKDKKSVKKPKAVSVK